ncbi:T6SS immunity protein Tli4 family protein [Trinickia sp. EG282A]|uniref:T6SS immunity protein Tli4 family protein n=1 Tax=Trinickia sp. EG282A TaxID=3237013 RepID=UPI0034D2D9F3
MVERETQLKAGKHEKGYALISVRRPSQSIAIFQLSRQLLMGPSLGFEAHRWNKGRAFMLQQTGTIPAQYESILTDVQTNVLPNLYARERDDIPSEPGFCLKDGFIANDGMSSQFEDAVISFKFAQWPGVLVSIETMTVTKLGQPSLLQRVDGVGLPGALMNLVSQIRILRRGQRTINGRAGEEILSTLPTDGGYRLHQFHWEADGTEVSNALKPTITVELESGVTRENGVPTRPLLTNEEAIALFDAVANSVRLRPVRGTH